MVMVKQESAGVVVVVETLPDYHLPLLAMQEPRLLWPDLVFHLQITDLLLHSLNVGGVMFGQQNYQK